MLLEQAVLVLGRSARALARSPKFSIAVITCWTLTLSAAAATYSLADAYFFRPPAHVADPDRVFRIFGAARREASESTSIPRFDYEFFRTLELSVPRAAVAAYAISDQSALLSKTTATLRLASVTPQFFRATGVRPTVGRLLGESPSVSADGLPIVLSHRMWRQYFGGARDVIGQSVRIRNRHFNVVGVTPPGFTGGEARGIDAWVSLEESGDLVRGQGWKSADAWWLAIIVRLRPGDSPQVLESRSAAILAAELEGSRAKLERPRILAVPLIPGAAPLRSDLGRAVALVAAAGAVLLLIASVNIGGLFLLRGLARQRELAIRRALGASRRTVVFDVLAEVFVLTAAASGLAMLVVAVVGGAVRGALLPDVELLESSLPIRTTLIVCAATLVGVFFVGTITAASALMAPVLTSIGSQQATESGRQQLTRGLIIGGQAGATTALVAGAILLTSNLVALRTLDLGLEISNVVLVSAGRSYSLEHKRETQEFLDRIQTRVARVPQVQAAALATTAPFFSSAGVAVNAPDHPGVWQTKAGVPYLNAIGLDYFRTVGTKLVRGRFFGPADTTRGKQVVIINETFARMAWANADPTGRCLVLGANPGTPCSEVIGVVADARRFTLVPEEQTAQVYVTLGQNPFSDAYPVSVLLIKASSDQTASLPDLSRIVREEAPLDADVSVTSLEELTDPQVRPWRTAGTLWGLFGVISLFLTSVGVYCVLAYVAEQRKRELAIRLTLGASYLRVLIEMGGRNVRACAAGIAGGAAVATALISTGRTIEAVDATKQNSLLLVGGAALLVAIVTLVSCALPIARTSRQPLARSLQAD